MKTKALILFLLIGKISFSQSYPDESLTYSRPDISGTARSAGTGGAFGSVGADLGSLDINPAGLGLYRSTEFAITPGLKITNNQSVYDQNNTNASLPRLFLGQAGIEWTKILKQPSKSHEISFNAPHRLNSITFAINYQASNFYARSQTFSSYNNNSSMIDNYTNYLNSINVSPANIPNLEAALANFVNLIGYNSTTGKYFSNAPAPVYQSGDIETRGTNSKINLGFGGNFNDKLYFGLSVAIPIISYTTTTYISETNNNDTVSSFDNYNITSVLSETGVGVTGALGLIYRPVTWLRLGAAYHLPTWYSMNESYQSGINSTFDTGGYAITNSVAPYALPNFKYDFRSPMMGTFSASFFLKQLGFLSIDYQIQNLGSSHFNFESGNEAQTQSVNDTIKAYYAIEHTIRVGFEGAYKILRVRGGYSYSSSPYKSGMAPPGYGGAKQSITAGLGLRFDRFFIDLAYIYSFTTDVSYPLAADNVYNNYNSSTMLLTLGWKLNQGKNRRSRGNNNNNNTVPPADQPY